MKGTVAPSSSRAMAAATCTGLAASSRARRCSIGGSMGNILRVKPGMIRNRGDCASLDSAGAVCRPGKLPLGIDQPVDLPLFIRGGQAECEREQNTNRPLSDNIECYRFRYCPDRNNAHD